MLAVNRGAASSPLFTAEQCATKWPGVPTRAMFIRPFDINADDERIHSGPVQGKVRQSLKVTRENLFKVVPGLNN